MTAETEVERALDLFRRRMSARGDVVDLVLFGSRARGDAGAESDTDIAVILRRETAPGLDTSFALADVAFDVLLETGVLIEPLAIAERAWRMPARHSNPGLLRRIAREGRPIGVTA